MTQTRTVWIIIETPTSSKRWHGTATNIRKATAEAKARIHAGEPITLIRTYSDGTEDDITPKHRKELTQ